MRSGSMSYGLQISASGAMTAMYRQDVLANNLANMNTVGFKPDVPSTRARQAVRQEDGLPGLPSDPLLEKLGAGTLLNPNRVSLAQGPVQITGNPLDVAIQGDGFFVVKDENSPTGERLTRDGRFIRSNDGTLAMASTGLAVLDTGGRPIRLDDRGKVRIDADGTVSQNAQQVAKLRLVDVPQRGSLRKVGASMFDVPPGQADGPTPATGTLRQGAVEGSGVDEIRTLMSITETGREVDANIAMIQRHDRLLDRAINTLGRVT